MINIVTNKLSSERRKAIVFPSASKSLLRLGENIRLATKRRRYTQTLISERTGLSRMTVRRVGQGDPSVSMGHYAAVLNVLGLVTDFELVARDDELGRKLQDIDLLKKPK